MSFLDIKIGIIAFLLIATITFITQWLSKKWPSNTWLWRKLLHIISLCSCAFAVYNFSSKFHLGVIFLLFSLLLGLTVQKKWLQISTGKSLGIALFPLAFGLLLLLPNIYTNVIVLSIVVLSFADAFAGIIGQLYGKQLVFLYEPKSLVGFSTFFITSCAILLIANYIGFYQISYIPIIVISLVIALSELFSWRGSDNLLVPIVAALLLQLYQHHSLQLQASIYFLIATLPTGIFIYYKKWLTIGGLFAALFVGIVTVIMYSESAIAMPAIFLIIGSVASKLNKQKDTSQEKKGRNAVQVFANGLVATLCIICYCITQQHIFFIAFIASYAISTCDTCSSEMGKYFKGKTFSITTFKPISIGLSGGVSISGTIGGVIGCFVLVLFAHIIFSNTLLESITIFGIGFAGMIVDSILGSIFQAKYINSQGVIHEDEFANDSIIKGYNWITNNTVNIMSNIVTILLFLIITIVQK